VLTEISEAYFQQTGIRLQIESVGGVQAAQRIQAGEIFDIVLLGSDAIDKLIAAHALDTGTRHDWVKCHVAVATRIDSPSFDLSTETAVKAAILNSPSISYSTGPSGVYLEKLFERWGILENLRPRIVVPPPGLAVGKLIAQGDAALGFQQMSELIGVEGIRIEGTLPSEIAYITTFSAAITSSCKKDAAREKQAQAFLNYLSSDQCEKIKQQQGMFWH
jgi:molybdate transport system substrate-binding protein